MWYVIQTITGKEQELVDLVYKMLPKTVYKECFFLKRQLLKRLGGEWLEVTETLFPAYVFLDLTNADEVFYELKRIPEFSKLLGDNLGNFWSCSAQMNRPSIMLTKAQVIIWLGIRKCIWMLREKSSGWTGRWNILRKKSYG